MKSLLPKINLIQDLATPHNNILIKQFKADNFHNIKLWYALEQDQNRYQWKNNISHEHFPAEIYGNGFNWKFIKYCLLHKEEQYFIVGWANINTIFLHLIFFLLRRPYNHWTDLPKKETAKEGIRKQIMRWLGYVVLRYSRAKVFCVGVTALRYFYKRGFPKNKLVNLPIFFETNEDLSALHAQREQIFERFGIDPGDFVISAGSRLIHEKGYDLLIEAIALLDVGIREHIKVLIVGSGELAPVLKTMILNLKLDGHVILEKWLDISDFKALIAISDVFIQPARVDSYGGTALGMALGVPVIGSYGAGAAVDRIDHGRSGFLYDAEDTQTLANFIELLYRNPSLCKSMGDQALKTARAWPPSRGVQIMVDNALYNTL